MSGYKVIGTAPSRVDAPSKVAGRARYAPDVSLPRLAYGAILRSPHAHARIRSIDTNRALALPGVYAVATAADLPEAADRTERLGEGTVNFRYQRDNTFAGEKALYHGHPVAGVAARTAEIAREALSLIDVDYEVLPAVVDVDAASAPGAPILHEHIRTKSPAGTGDAPSNVAEHFRHVKGDPACGFDEADVVLERSFTSQTVHQGYLEPHAATAEWSADGTLTIYTTTQGSFSVRSHVHELLHLPESAIKVVPTEVGGAFGGKNASFVDVPAAVLARKAGRPVRIVMTQEEVLLASNPSSGTRTRVRLGATKSGRIVAAEGELRFEAGAYPGSPIGMAAPNLFAAYDIPNARVDGYDVLVNKPRAGTYRAPGTTPVNFAMETLVDELAERLGLDPVELRLKNCATDGTTGVTGSTLTHGGGHKVLEALKRHPHLHAALPPAEGPWKTGRGIAFAYWGNWGARSSVTLQLNGDGSLSLVTGSVDITGTRTTIAMQAAEALGVELSRLTATVGDTDTAGYSDTSAGSRTTMATGIAAVEAANDLVREMRSRAAALWKTDAERVVYEAGELRTQDGSLRMGLSELGSRLGETGGALRGTGDVNVGSWGGSFAAHIADVAVDTETGKVRVLRYTAIQDVGRAIHPGQVDGQLRGGATQGIGWALYEACRYDETGRMVNPHYLDYRMPTALDVPNIETVLVENPWPGHPYGVRGVGEAPIVPPPGAIGNAIHAAVGARMNVLPMEPEQVAREMGVV